MNTELPNVPCIVIYWDDEMEDADGAGWVFEPTPGSVSYRYETLQGLLTELADPFWVKFMSDRTNWKENVKLPTCDACGNPATEVHAGTTWFCAPHFEQFTNAVQAGADFEQALNQISA